MILTNNINKIICFFCCRKTTMYGLFALFFFAVPLPLMAQDRQNDITQDDTATELFIEMDEATAEPSASLFDTILTRQVNPQDDDMPLIIPSMVQEGGMIDPNFLKDDARSFDDYSYVTLRILDKITAQSKSYELEIGKTVAYGGLRIRPQACKKSPPIEEPESAAFLQIWESKKNGAGDWIFSGWMFASSPSLSSMEHAVYDVWVLDCMDDYSAASPKGTEQ